MPSGDYPVPINDLIGKREEGGYEFFYNGWKQEHPTRENCRFCDNEMSKLCLRLFVKIVSFSLDSY
jgi:hypothetical protein